ncbi:MAG: hypothetical protein JXB34_13780 [Bacteroidales bacterium]|nr:hypothetical protein [Bacteroidales bacterium]
MNKRWKIFTAVCWIFLSMTAQEWRSSLYPENWYPGYKDTGGRFLHDFSFAGYHAGEKEIPFVNDNIIDVTKEPFLADNTGADDVTDILQAALDSAGAAGGGVVFLPAGTYRVVAGNNYALRIKYNNVVLRGEGIGKTFIFNDQPSMRKKCIILVQPVSGGDWYSPEGTYEKLSKDVRNLDTAISVSNVAKYKQGDWIVITSNVTDGFIADHKMTGLWNSSLPGLAFYRQVKYIDTAKSRIILDAPVRYDLKIRDNARINIVNKHLEEAGIEYLSIGNRQNDLTGWGDLDYKNSGTGAYDVDNSIAVKFLYVVNSWMRNVSTYKPEINTLNVHLTSHGVLLEKSRFLTLDSCYFGFPQYEGENGNGYMYTLRSNDCLINNSVGDNGRHNFDFKSMMTSGNVILRSTGKDSRYASDFHMHLSVANLFDNHIVDNDFLEAAYRPYGTVQHGQTTSQSVFWNTFGIKASGGGSSIIKTQQWGHGYVIGTQGNVTGVTAIGGYNTEPVDFVEGVGNGATLFPVSLYEHQLSKRLKGYDFSGFEEDDEEQDPSGLADGLQKVSFRLYPLPARESINLSAVHNIEKLELFSPDGTLIMMQGNIRQNEYNLQVAELTTGCYFIRIFLANGECGTSFFMKM